MKYKSQLSGKLKGFIEWQLEHYHENRRQLEQYKRDIIPSPTPNYSAEPHGSGGESRPTELLTLRMTTDLYIIETTRCVEAIDRVINRLDAVDYKLIDLVFWKNQCTVEGAGLTVGYSPRTSYRHVNAILTAIAKELGYLQI